jgi:hypothetical protein
VTVSYLTTRPLPGPPYTIPVDAAPSRSRRSCLTRAPTLTFGSQPLVTYRPYARRMDGHRRLVRASLATAFVLVVAACTASHPATAPSGSAAPVELPSAAPVEVPSDASSPSPGDTPRSNRPLPDTDSDMASQLWGWCHTDRMSWVYPDAAPYQGKGPHPVMVVSSSTYPFDAVPPAPGVLSSSTLPADAAPATLQLVACDNTVHDSQVSSCPTDGAYRIPVLQTVEHYVVYELRTGREVTQVDITGAITDCDTLRTSYTVEGPWMEGPAPRLIAIVSDDQRRQAFRDIVNGRAE